MNGYLKYKNINHDWVSEIPDHWNISPLKYLAILRNSTVDRHILPGEKNVNVIHYTDVYKNDIITNSYVSQQGTCTELEFKNFQLNKNDVIITKDSESPEDIAIPCLIADDLTDTVCGYHLCLITANADTLYGPFLLRVFQTNWSRSYFNVSANGITRYGLSLHSILNFPVVFPSLKEQAAIAAYLDQKTAIIDELIAKAERKIALLQELRAATINQAVTKGLDPHARRKDSGVEWIGEIPEHWEVIKLKYIGSSIIGLTYSPNDITDAGEGTLVLRASNIQGNKIDFSDCTFVDVIISDKLRTKIGDILICARSGSADLIGKNVMIDENSAGYSFGAFMCVYRSNANSFLQWYFNSNVFISQKGLFATSTINQLTTGTLNNLYCALPGSKEQQEINEYLGMQTGKISSLIEQERLRINKFTEYRKSLITEVVTGKICVLEHDEIPAP